MIPIGFNLDGSLEVQTRLLIRLAECLDLKKAHWLLRLWTNKKGRATFAAQLRRLRAQHPLPWISFFGSGDFHYLSAILIETLFAEESLTVVVIDNHPGWFTQRPHYHCGNWVPRLLSLWNVQAVYLVGANSKDIAGHRFWFGPFEDLVKGRLRLHPYYKEKIFVPFKRVRTDVPDVQVIRRSWGSEFYFETVLKRGPERFFQELAMRLSGQRVYLSIDKDCLNAEAAVTDWEQGCFTLNEFIEGIRLLKNNVRIVGVDICGERAQRPLSGFLKCLESGRFLRLPRVGECQRRANRINEETNLNILDVFLP